jgi:NADH-quinone oxidoreductase subunit L
MFRLWYMTFFGESRSPEAHPHESPWSMRVPLVILGVLSVCGGWIGADRFGAFLAPAVGSQPVEAGSSQLELALSVLAVAVAALGWYVAHRLYFQHPDEPARLASAVPAGYTLLVHKYYVDEIYRFLIVKPILAFSKFFLEWVVDFAILGGLAWLLGGIATLIGAILQRWQSGNLRSYAAWLALGAAAILLFFLLPYTLSASGIDLWVRGR